MSVKINGVGANSCQAQIDFAPAGRGEQVAASKSTDESNSAASLLVAENNREVSNSGIAATDNLPSALPALQLAAENRRIFDGARQHKANLNQTLNDISQTGTEAARTAVIVLAAARPDTENTRNFILTAIDRAAALAATGDGEKTAQLLDTLVLEARALLKTVPANSSDHVLLSNYADHAAAQAAAFRAAAPQQGYDAAGNLAQLARSSQDAAAVLAKSNHPADARLLQTIAENSLLLAQTVDVAATNTNVTVGRALNESYRQIVNASFDQKIAGASDNTFFGLRQSPASVLRAEKQKMQVVFNELDRTMREEGVSLDRAWNLMFNDAHIDGWHKQPARVPGFPTRQEAAFFLRDNQTTRGLLIPMTDLARGFKENNNAAVDQASGQLIKSLQENRQWEIAHQLISEYQKNARTGGGRAEAEQIAGSEGWDKFKTQAGDFARDELPVLVLTTLISGGAGTGVKALATAAKWGPRAIKAVQAGAELATFIPTDRLLNDAINGKRADWSAGALARDAAVGAALMLGGSLLAKGVGRGWQFVRAQNFGVPALQQFGGRLIGLNGGEQSLLRSLVSPQGTGRLITSSEVTVDTLARLTSATRNEIALLKNTRTGQTMLIKGTREAVPQLSVAEAKKLAAEGWELEAHSHLRNLHPSVGDGRVIGQEGFGQRSSVIVDRKGNLFEFVPEQGFGGLSETISSGAAHPAPRPTITAANVASVVIPGNRQGAFAAWFNSLSKAELDVVWTNKTLRTAVEDRLRHPGGFHEWLPVSRAPKFKEWGVTAEQIMTWRNSTRDVRFVNPAGRHGGPGSTGAHNEIFQLIDQSSSFADYKTRIQNWAAGRLEGGVSSLPPELRP